MFTDIIIGLVIELVAGARERGSDRAKTKLAADKVDMPARVFTMS